MNLLFSSFLLLLIGIHEIEAQDCSGDSFDVYYSLAATDGMQFSLESVGPVSSGSKPDGKLKIVDVSPSDTYQSMLGFGAALTGSSAYLLHNRPDNDILSTLFDRNTGLGINYLRLPMGGSDFQPGTPYTYNDLPAGETDFPLENFSTAADAEFIVPVLQQILQINPDVLIVAVPWSAPAWMKDSQDLNFGALIDGAEYLNAYADYFIRFLQDYQEYNIPIAALSIQNEPLHEAYNYPSMRMSAQQMASFVAVLGPKLEQAGFGDIDLMVYDHNWDEVDYAISVINDAAAEPYVTGSALHCYAGNPGNTIRAHEAYPDKDVYFTECSGGEWSTDWDTNLWWNTYNLFVNQTRQYAKMVLFWNLALDENHGPKWDAGAGCMDCRGVVTIDGQSGQLLSVNVEGRILEQFNRFVLRDAVRVGSSEQIQDESGNAQDVQDVSNAAYVNPDGQLVVQVLTGWEHNDPISLRVGEAYFTVDWSHIPGVGPDDHKQFASSLITFVQRCQD